jgi:hypothetical protein
MGHDSERAAVIYQHEARGADLVITSAIDAHIETAKASQSPSSDGSPEAQLKSGNGPLIRSSPCLASDQPGDWAATR